MKIIEAAKDLHYYLSLPYTTVLKKDEDGDIVAHIEELDGCVSHGADEADAIKNLKLMQKAWIEACIAAKREVPEPEPEEVVPSGKYLQRLPRSLHQRLIRLAKREGVSLNSLTTAILTDGAAAKLFGDVLIDKMATSLLCSVDVSVRSPHGPHDLWETKMYPWLTPDYISTPGLVRKAHQVMRMVIPDDRTEEIEHVNEKETRAFGYGH